MKNVAIILASGKGERTGLNIPKQFMKVAGKTVFEHTIDVFEKHPLIDEIIIVSNIDYIGKAEDLVIKNDYKKVKKNTGRWCNPARKLFHRHICRRICRCKCSYT